MGEAKKHRNSPHLAARHEHSIQKESRRFSHKRPIHFFEQVSTERLFHFVQFSEQQLRDITIRFDGSKNWPTRSSGVSAQEREGNRVWIRVSFTGGTDGMIEYCRDFWYFDKNSVMVTHCSI